MSFKKRKLVTSVSAPFVVPCTSAICGAGGRKRWGDHLFSRSMGGATVASVSIYLSWVTSWAEAASPHHTSSKQPERFVNTPAPSARRCVGRGDGALSGIKRQTYPAMLCFPRSCPLFQETKAASVFPHPPHTVKKPWASVSTSKVVLAAALEMEHDNFGYKWLVCSYGWWRHSAGGHAKWGHLRVARAEG